MLKHDLLGASRFQHGKLLALHVEERISGIKLSLYRIIDIPIVDLIRNALFAQS